MADVAVYETENDEPDENPLAFMNRLFDENDAPVNLAEDMEESELGALGARAHREWTIDKTSRSEWEDDYNKAMDLAMQKAEDKNYPWARAANVKFPLLTTAAMQFAARAYPAIVAGPNAVKSKVIGKDEDGQKRARGERVARHMSYQLSEEMGEWEEETDRLLHILPIAGLCYRKVYFDPNLGRNVSELVHPLKLVINDGAKSIDTVPRITHEIELYPTEIETKMRSGYWRQTDLRLPESEDEDAPQMFLEQHRTFDLDEDGYPEPYIVTVHAESQAVVRIAANFEPNDIAFNEAGEIAHIEKTQYFVKFPFVPNPTGGFHDIGFGYLLRPINDAVNTTINQLLDAGHLSNLGGGFLGSGARLRGGRYRRRPGEWTPVSVPGGSLRENMVPFPSQEPSLVLFQMLGLLIDAGKDISSVKDIMTGESRGRNESPTTIMALIEQGMQVFTAIYKRVFRSLKAEYKLLYRLNSLYLEQEQYFTVTDDQESVAPQDYAMGDYDMVPTADPNAVMDMQRMARAEVLLPFKDDPAFDGMEVRRRYLEAARFEDIDTLLAKEPSPNAELMARADEIEIKKRETDIKYMTAMSEITKRKAEVIKLIAEAEAAEIGPQLDQYKAELTFLESITQMGMQNVGQGSVPSVEGGAGNQGAASAP